ncbi:nuclease homologue [Granulicatella balaenopterae]|uniref:Nuclease homologue n=1 Tax=Granulicatella balaenopterae TaxID=137733 RepID=A0A1H9LP58_9LACT|nr:thermonuclease family protein [Granulicatella balaenopterae]SER12663.1 nuclease homologue [Granulicatella balaenopterae]
MNKQTKISKETIKKFGGLMITVLTLLGIKFGYLEKEDIVRTNHDSRHHFDGEDFSVFKPLTKYQVEVDRVIDGDTYHLMYDNERFKARLLIVDTPETEKPDKKAQPFADEATERMKELITNSNNIEVSFDVGDPTDHYNRALVYLYIDGKLVQDTLLEEGLATIAYANKPNTTLLKEMKKYQKIAKNNKLGVWSKKGYVTKRGYNPSVFKQN